MIKVNSKLMVIYFVNLLFTSLVRNCVILCKVLLYIFFLAKTTQVVDVRG